MTLIAFAQRLNTEREDNDRNTSGAWSRICFSLLTMLPAGWEMTWWTAIIMCNTGNAKEFCEATSESRKKHRGEKKPAPELQERARG
jgi:hypothetical protein